ncbi:MAG: two-component response regulator, partial [Chloroflexota bacterium]
EHAIDAFEMASLDYLLKPVTVDRMENTISRLIQRMRVEVIPSFMIITTPTLVIHVPSQNHAPLRWRTEKAKQVFLYLLLHANQPVLRDTLTDIFWDGFAQQKAAGQLHTTVYLIRKLCAPLEQSLEILSRNGTYTLTIATNLVDFLTLRNVVDGVLQGTRVLMPADLALFESFCADLLTDVTDIWVETYRAEVDFLLQGISKFLKSNAVFYVNNRPLRIACDAFLGKYERLFREDNA